MEKLFIPKIGKFWSLNPMEKESVKQIVIKREQENSRNGIVDKKMSHRSSREINLDGYGGELVFCREFGLKLDRTWHSRGVGSGDDGDTQLPNGKWIDVKVLTSRDFMTPKWKDQSPVDYYAMLKGDFNDGYQFFGFISKENHFQAHRLRMIKVESYVTPCSELRELFQIDKDLIESIKLSLTPQTT